MSCYFCFFNAKVAEIFFLKNCKILIAFSRKLLSVVVYEGEEVYEHPLYMAELCWLMNYLWN